MEWEGMNTREEKEGDNGTKGIKKMKKDGKV
jgi:hypothetical protein